MRSKIVSVNKRETSKGALWEINFDDKNQVLTMDNEKGSIAERSIGRSFDLSVQIKPSKNPNYPSSAWLDSFEIAEEDGGAIAGEWPEQKIVDVRLECLRMAQLLSDEAAGVLHGARLYEQYVLGYEQDLESPAVPELLDDIPF